MNNNLKLRCYLAGPMQFVSDEEAVDWREDATNKLEDIGIHVFNPTNKDDFIDCNEIGEERNLLEALAAKGNWNELHKKMSTIVHADLKMVDRSDIIIVNYPIGAQTCGTIHEIIEARRQKKKVYVFYDYKNEFDKCMVDKLSYWFIWLVGYNYIFKSLDDIIKHIKTQSYVDIIYNCKNI